MAGDSRSAFSGLEEGSELIFVVEHIDGKLGEPVRFGLHPSDLAGPAGVLFSEFRADSRKHRHGPGIDLKLLLMCITNLRQMALVGFSRQSAGPGFNLKPYIPEKWDGMYLLFGSALSRKKTLCSNWKTRFLGSKKRENQFKA